jgi:hypothetical protein
MGGPPLAAIIPWRMALILQAVLTIYNSGECLALDVEA